MSDLLQQAHNHRTCGEYEQAEALYRQVLTEQGVCAEACWGLGHTLMNEGDFDACVAFFRRALETEPTNLQFLLDLAKLLTMLGEYDEARPLFTRIIEIGGNERIVSEAKKQLAYL